MGGWYGVEVVVAGDPKPQSHTAGFAGVSDVSSQIILVVPARKEG
jgi:hypothetical protein